MKKTSVEIQEQCEYIRHLSVEYPEKMSLEKVRFLIDNALMVASETKSYDFVEGYLASEGISVLSRQTNNINRPRSLSVMRLD